MPSANLTSIISVDPGGTFQLPDLLPEDDGVLMAVRNSGDPLSTFITVKGSGIAPQFHVESVLLAIWNGNKWEYLKLGGPSGAGSGVGVKDEGSAIATAALLNFIGAGVTAAAGPNGQVNVTIPGGGGGGSIDVQDEGVTQLTATILNFVGAGVTAADGGGGVATITIPGGGGGGADYLLAPFSTGFEDAGDPDVLTPLTGTVTGGPTNWTVTVTGGDARDHFRAGDILRLTGDAAGAGGVVVAVTATTITVASIVTGPSAGPDTLQRRRMAFHIAGAIGGSVGFLYAVRHPSSGERRIVWLTNAIWIGPLIPGGYTDSWVNPGGSVRGWCMGELSGLSTVLGVDGATGELLLRESGGFYSWREPVANAGSLPGTLNNTGDIRQALDTGKLHWWNGSAWALVPDETPVTGKVVGNNAAVPVYDHGTGTLALSTLIQFLAANAGLKILQPRIVLSGFASAEFKSVDSTTTASARLKSGDASAGDSGDVELDPGTATGNRGNVRSTHGLKYTNRALRSEEYDNGSSGAATSIAWLRANNQKLTLTAACTLAFTDPDAPGHFTLKVVQDGTGGWTVTWPGSVKWAGGTPPTLGLGVGALNVIHFYFDGVNYYGYAIADAS